MRPELPLLMEARARIADPAKWGQGVRGVNGTRPIHTCCVAEAVEDSSPYGTRWWPRRQSALNSVYRATGATGHLTEWNDAPERTHAEVLAAFDKAIVAAGGRAS